MKILFISDTHRRHDRLELEAADLIVHAGDFCSYGNETEVQEFLEWYAALDYPHKILIGGNHDRFLEESPAAFRQMLPSSITYLENSGIELGGLYFWGSPITPWFMDWAFNRERGPEIRAYWEQIPAHTDVLITHGPPYGILDKTIMQMHAGCKDLLDIVQEKVQPKLHVFGHIHEAYGQKQIGDTHYINASNSQLGPFTRKKGVLVDL